MSHLLQERKTEVTIACILTIAISIVYCLYIVLIGPNLTTQSPAIPVTPPPTFDQSGRPITTATTNAPKQATAPSPWTAPLISMIVLLGLVAAGTLAGFFGIKQLNQAKMRRDQQRLADLPAIAQAFQRYKDKVGTYPVSTTYRSDYYTGINLSNDWHYYGLPNDDQMRQYLPNWPVSDPGIDYHAKSQVNQYMYYPHDNGGRFDLYAHLELHQSAPNYNQQDNLPQAWGSYNYKISSDSPAPMVTPIVAVASPPVSTEPQAAEPVQPQPTTQAQSEAPISPPEPAPTQPVGSYDNDIEPQAATAAASASLDQGVAEQQAIGAIDQLFAQGGQLTTPNQPQSQPLPQPQSPSPAEPDPQPAAQPGREPMDPHQTNSNQLDQLAQAMAARAQIAEGSTTPEITQSQPPQKT